MNRRRGFVTLVMPPRTPQLRPYVSALGYHDGAPPPGRERVLPSGMTALLINLDQDELRTYDSPDRDAHVHRIIGAAMDGPSSHARVIDTIEQRCIIYVSFTLGGSSPFTPAPLAAMVDQLVALDELWGRDGATLRERLLEATSMAARLGVVEDVLLEHLGQHAEPCHDIAYAAALLERNLPVADVASRLGRLPTTFTRRFRERVGLPPKLFARVRRLQRVLTSVAPNGDVDWAETAVANGFYDQAHLVNEFRHLTGITPTAYRPRAASEQNHVPLTA
jgi:AraC-like DNA-binding protein